MDIRKSIPGLSHFPLSPLCAVNGIHVLEELSWKNLTRHRYVTVSVVHTGILLDVELCLLLMTTD